MSQTTLRRMALPLSLLSIAIILLAVITAVIHLDRAITMGLFGGSHSGGMPTGAPPTGAGMPPTGAPAGGGAPTGALSVVFQQLPLLFFLNFLSYLVLAVALYLPPLKKFQRILRWVLVALAAITIIAYFAMVGFHTNITGYTDKIIELALIVLLVIEDRKAARKAKG